MKELSRVEKEKDLAVYINGNRITKTADAYFRLRKCLIVSFPSSSTKIQSGKCAKKRNASVAKYHADND